LKKPSKIGVDLGDYGGLRLLECIFIRENFPGVLLLYKVPWKQKPLEMIKSTLKIIEFFEQPWLQQSSCTELDCWLWMID